MSRLAKLLCVIFVFMNMTIEAQAEVQKPTTLLEKTSIEALSNPFSKLLIENEVKEDSILIPKEEPSLLDNILAQGNIFLPFRTNLLFPLGSVTEEENEEQDQEDDLMLMPYGQVVNIESNLCMREKADEESNVIYGLYKGMTFSILDKTEEWYYIQHNQNKGYVHEQFVEEYEDEPPHEIYVAPKPEPKSNEVYAEPIGKPIKAELTAYCNCPICSDNWGSKTAMGTSTRLGVIAVPTTISLGSKVYIPHLKFLKSDGIFSAEDRGGAIKVKADGTHVIDVWFPSHSEALKFGRVKTTIYLMD